MLSIGALTTAAGEPQALGRQQDPMPLRLAGLVRLKADYGDWSA
jgi:hypothetical protein